MSYLEYRVRSVPTGLRKILYLNWPLTILIISTAGFGFLMLYSVAEDMVFLPFAYVEAAANILTNPAVDPFGKIPEFKFSAVRVEKAEDSSVAAE